MVCFVKGEFVYNENRIKLLTELELKSVQFLVATYCSNDCSLENEIPWIFFLYNRTQFYSIDIFVVGNPISHAELLPSRKLLAAVVEFRKPFHRDWYWWQ